jgi:hypothetical protein
MAERALRIEYGRDVFVEGRGFGRRRRAHGLKNRKGGQQRQD